MLIAVQLSTQAPVSLLKNGQQPSTVLSVQNPPPMLRHPGTQAVDRQRMFMLTLIPPHAHTNTHRGSCFQDHSSLEELAIVHTENTDIGLLQKMALLEGLLNP